MALKIKPTPVLKGKDAKTFLNNLKQNESKKTSDQEMKEKIEIIQSILKD